ncbi:MAG: hypothetical protein LBO09_04225 [Candidatus Peribacteria bacterium]|jgi:CYTH domain-containing protein|nr:hypothetical protein [Candidatus Peribacteria bacterium]
MNNTLDSREKCSLESPIFDLFPQEIFNEKYTPLRMLLNTLNPAQKEALLQQTENLESVFQEQERKFLLHSLPENFSQYPSASVQQHYLFTQDPEVRIRQKGEEYFLTIKRGTGIIRTEIEISLSPQTFQELLPLTTVSITKKRSAIPLNDGHIAEVDLYPNGLQIVEVEFKDQESLTSFSVPPWFGAEVSGKKEYANVNLATPKEPTLQKVEIETSTEIKEINSIEKFEVGQ